MQLSILCQQNVVYNLMDHPVESVQFEYDGKTYAKNLTCSTFPVWDLIQFHFCVFPCLPDPDREDNFFN